MASQYQGWEDDLRFILAAADELKQYLDSSVVIWPMRGEVMPLSPANFMFAQFRLGDLIEGPVRKALNDINTTINAHRIRWERRIESELPIRINQYAGLVEDLIEYGKIDASYATSISVRVKVALLLQAATNPVESALLTRLNGLDKALETKLVPGGFVWDVGLQEKFTPEKFGYLYVMGK
ncbi:MAG: hypothetical protein KBD67_03880 [Anaerolineaceae bacterium]|nr:hypothetical protein [Anaerolineaceae bacterium]